MPKKEEWINWWSGRSGFYYYDDNGKLITQEEYDNLPITEDKPIKERTDLKELSDKDLEEYRLRLECELFSVEAECNKRGI